MSNFESFGGVNESNEVSEVNTSEELMELRQNIERNNENNSDKFNEYINSRGFEQVESGDSEVLAGLKVLNESNVNRHREIQNVDIAISIIDDDGVYQIKSFEVKHENSSLSRYNNAEKYIEIKYQTNDGAFKIKRIDIIEGYTLGDIKQNINNVKTGIRVDEAYLDVRNIILLN